MLQQTCAAKPSHQSIHDIGNAYSDGVGSFVNEDSLREHLSTGRHRMMLPFDAEHVSSEYFAQCFSAADMTLNNRMLTLPCCFLSYRSSMVLVRCDDLMNSTACCGLGCSCIFGVEKWWLSRSKTRFT